MSSTFDDVNINMCTCTYIYCMYLCMCVQFSIKTFKYVSMFYLYSPEPVLGCVSLCTNVASCGNLWDIEHMSTFTTSPVTSHISNTQLCV